MTDSNIMPEISKSIKGEKRTSVIRIPMSASEARAVKDKASELGIPIARLIRRVVFGIDYEINHQISPNTVNTPKVLIPNDSQQAKVSRQRK